LPFSLPSLLSSFSLLFCSFLALFSSLLSFSFGFIPFLSCISLRRRGFFIS
jgi:hypothetical protein